jgi:hypothetical protein
MNWFNDWQLPFFFFYIYLSNLQLLGFMYGWLTFYHQGYEVAKECRPYMTDLQVRLQKVAQELIYQTFHLSY